MNLGGKVISLQDDTYQEYSLNVIATVRLFESLGFVINPSKSVLLPSQTIEFLGFILDSTTMSIEITQRKKTKILTLLEAVLNTVWPSIRQVASLLGNLVATSEAVPLARLRYRSLELDKIRALKNAHGNYEGHMQLSPTSRQDLLWWKRTLPTQKGPITVKPVDLVLYSDASLEGWGGHCDQVTTGGRWTDEEKRGLDINVLELLAAKFVLFSFCKDFTLKHVKLMIDNQTAVSYVNRQGEIHSLRCNKVSREIWLWAAHRNIWLSAAHIPGSHNTIADFHSRTFEDATEWSLNDLIFNVLTSRFGVDMFAYRINTKLPRYVSWHPGPDSCVIDAFSVQ